MAFEITPTRGGGILWAPSGHCPKRMGRGEIACHGGASVASRGGSGPVFPIANFRLSAPPEIDSH